MSKEISIIDQAKKLIINSEKAFEAVLPKNFDVQKFIATFCLEVQKNPKLAQCDNLIEVARDVANFGLIIGGLAQQSHLIPFEKKKKVGNEWVTESTKAQLIIGYRGYIAKLEEAGYTVEAEIVTEEEVNSGCFQEVRGSEPKIIHNPIRKGIRTRENIALAYCIIKGKDTNPVISVLSKEEMEEIGKTEKWNSDTKKKERSLSNVWLGEQRSTDTGQQYIKTVIRNAVKRVNLRIANEMSAYEGQRDAEIMRDITPSVSKTANAHTPPAAIEQAFKPNPNLDKILENFDKKIAAEESEKMVEAEFEEIVSDNSEAIEVAYKKVVEGIRSMKTQKAVNTAFDVSYKDDIEFIKSYSSDYYENLLLVKNAALEALR